jgi:hypothetical protein
MTSFFRRYIIEARLQSSVETESWAVRHFRLAAANISIMFGVIAACLIPFGNYPRWALPSFLIWLVGGALGVGVYLAGNARLSRRFGTVALAVTVVGIGSLIAFRELL